MVWAWSGLPYAWPARRSPPRAPPPWPSTRCRPYGRPWRIRRRFLREIAHDRFRRTPSHRAVRRSCGEDVLLVFVESYGRVRCSSSLSSASTPRSTGAPRCSLRLLLAQHLPHLATLGGLSWLAHSTLRWGPGRRPAPVRPARPGRPPRPHPGVQARHWRASVPCRNRRGVARGLDLLPATTRSTTTATSATAAGFGMAVPDQYTFSRCNVASSPSVNDFAEVDLVEAIPVDANPSSLGRHQRRLDLRPPPRGGVDEGLARRRRATRAAYGRRSSTR